MEVSVGPLELNGKVAEGERVVVVVKSMAMQVMKQSISPETFQTVRFGRREIVVEGLWRDPGNGSADQLAITRASGVGQNLSVKDIRHTTLVVRLGYHEAVLLVCEHRWLDAAAALGEPVAEGAEVVWLSGGGGVQDAVLVRLLPKAKCRAGDGYGVALGLKVAAVLLPLPDGVGSVEES